MKKYILRNKDEDLIEFSLSEVEIENFVTVEKLKIENEPWDDFSKLPVSLWWENNEETLAEFIKSRKVPSNRTFVKNILNEINSDSITSYIDISYGLSLNDSFWIVPEKDREMKWEDVNLYKNPFSERLQYASFGLPYYGDSLNKISPEFTTNGMLKKCWIREDGKIFLIKSNSQQGINIDYETNHLEVFSEYYMSQVAKIFNDSSIHYDIVEYHGELCSKCELFTNENISYVPMNSFFEKEDYDNAVERCIKIYEKENFEDLMLFDAVIGNRDRHLGNFGILFDNEKNDFIGPAPIFDNGESILNYCDLYKELDFEMYSTFRNKLEQPFWKVFENYVSERHLQIFKNLENFKFERHPLYNVSEIILERLEKHFHNISREALKIIEKNKVKNEVKNNETERQR